jgi:tetrahydromethanopterin S-methyltransferase subunit G
MITAMREKWTDERLDDLNHKVDVGFQRVDRRFDSVDARLDRLDSRFDTVQRTMVQGVIALTGGMLAGFAAMIALVATQL